jgi:hypothetical protein
MIPNLAYLYVHTPEWRSPRLWIPLFLLWIPVILLSPLILLVIFGLCLAGEVDPFRAIGVIWAVLCSLPGTHVRVSTENTQVVVRVL